MNKPYSTSTLESFKKKELIEEIRILENNLFATKETVERQFELLIKIIDNTEKADILLNESKKLYSIEKYDRIKYCKDGEHMCNTYISNCKDCPLWINNRCTSNDNLKNTMEVVNKWTKEQEQQ